MKTKELIAAELRATRARANRPLREVAETTGVTVSTVANWEQGVSAPDLDKAAKLADFYGVTLDELVGRNK